MFVFLPDHRAAVVLCNEVHKQREKMRGGERVDARRNYTTSKVIVLICMWLL
jgi:hypothetical protein